MKHRYHIHNQDIYEEVFETGYQDQTYLETQGMMAEVMDDGKVFVHGLMQCPYYVKGAVMRALNLGEDKVRIAQDATGGGFGGCTVNIVKNDDLITIKFSNDNESFQCVVKEIKDEYGILSYLEVENNYLAFDHLLSIVTSINRLKNKAMYTDIIFHIMPEYFTLKELQLVYEAILDKKLIDPVFRREIASKVIKTNKSKKDGGHRPSSLYKYIRIKWKN